VLNNTFGIVPQWASTIGSLHLRSNLTKLPSSRAIGRLTKRRPASQMRDLAILTALPCFVKEAHSEAWIDIIDKERIPNVPRFRLFVYLLIQNFIIFKFLLHWILFSNWNLTGLYQICEITCSKIVASLTNLRLVQMFLTLRIRKKVSIRFSVKNWHIY